MAFRIRDWVAGDEVATRGEKPEGEGGIISADWSRGIQRFFRGRQNDYNPAASAARMRNALESLPRPAPNQHTGSPQRSLCGLQEVSELGPRTLRIHREPGRRLPCRR